MITGASVELDHLVYATPDLAVTVSELAAQLDVQPVEGGPHVGLGTRNFLLGLGGRAYLEIVGPDPEQPTPAQPRPFGVDKLDAPALVAWAAATDDIDATTASAHEQGLDLGGIQDMSRRKPDGTLLTWRLTTPIVGVVPFLIEWGATPHPSGEVPTVRLESFVIDTPDPDDLAATLGALGVTVQVRHSARASLVAQIGTLILTG